MHKPLRRGAGGPDELHEHGVIHVVFLPQRVRDDRSGRSRHRPDFCATRCPRPIASLPEFQPGHVGLTYKGRLWQALR